MTDKTQRERDERAARRILGNNSGRHLPEAIVDAIAEAREHGRRDSDAWRAAMREAAKRVREANRDRDSFIVSRPVDWVCEELDRLAGTEPPRTYEDGVGESARRLGNLISEVSASSDEPAGRFHGRDRFQDLCLELHALAASTPPATPPATPSADVAGPGIDPRQATTYGPGDAVLDLEGEPMQTRLDDATPPEQPRSAAPPGDARRLLEELVEAESKKRAAMSGDVYASSVAEFDAALRAARAYLTSTPEAPPRTAAPTPVLAFLADERALFIRRDDMDGGWEVGWQQEDGSEEREHAGDADRIARVCESVLTMFAEQAEGGRG